VRADAPGAVSLELGAELEMATVARVHAVDRVLGAEPFPGFVESVPTLAALLVLFDPRRASAEDVSRWLLDRTAPQHARAAFAPQRARVHEIPMRYGGADGPDFGEAAAGLGLSAAELVRRHGVEHTVLMLGFRPGFAYLGPLEAGLRLPRRATPRTRVPAGSVGMAGAFTGVYPSASPGGWNVIGRSGVAFFDAGRDTPALVTPLDRVRFVETAAPIVARASSPSAPAGAGPPLAEILEGGALTTVQDRGRPGYRRFGVAPSGAMDAASLARANQAVGNAATAAALECTLTGPALRFVRTVQFAVSGADLGAVLWRDDLGRWPVPLDRAVRARPGNRLVFEDRRGGCRAYVAFAGGIDVPLVLGSRSTDVGAGFGGFGGRALCAGDVLRHLEGAAGPPDTIPLVDSLASSVELRVQPGPQHGALDPSTWDGREYRVSADADRCGLRLIGETLPLRGSGEVLSEAMAPGSIQVPPDGQPIVMGVEGPTTGGYVKPLIVAPADLWKLGQLVPGETRVRLVAEGERATSRGWTKG
jgi:antagonist of KipI